MDHPKAMQDRATKLFKAIFPSYSPFQNPFYSVASVDDQQDLLETLQSFRSRRIDAAVQSLFRRLLRFRPVPLYDADYRFRQLAEIDDLAIECAKRMAGKGYDNEYLSYFKKRLPLLTKANKSSSSLGSPDDMQAIVKRLKHYG